MKRIYYILAIFALLLCGTACTASPTSEEVQAQSNSIQSAQESSAAPSYASAESQMENPVDLPDSIAESGEHKAVLHIGEQQLEVTLYNTPAANSLYELLPLELTFEDYNSVEKIAYLTDALNIEGEPDSFDPDIGDLCLYAPWGNLSIFYQDFRNSSGLVSLGRIESGMEVISAESGFSATLEKSEQQIQKGMNS